MLWGGGGGGGPHVKKRNKESIGSNWICESERAPFSSSVYCHPYKLLTHIIAHTRTHVPAHTYLHTHT